MLSNSQEKFIEEKTGCFRERFENFIREIETDANKQFHDTRQAKKRLVAMLKVLEGAEAIIKREGENLEKLLRTVAGFDIEGTGELPQYKPRTVRIDDSTTAYACTDESVA